MKKVFPLSFKRELLICLLVVSLLPLFICSIGMIRSIKLKISGDYAKEAKAALDVIKGECDEAVSRLDAIGDTVCASSEVLQLLYAKDFEVKKDLYRALYSATADMRGSAAFSIYSIGGNRKYSTDERVSEEHLPTYFGSLDRVAADPDLKVYTNRNYASQNAGSCLRVVRGICDDRRNVVGYYVADIYTSALEALIDTAALETDCMILDRFGHVVYTNVSENGEQEAKLRRAILYGEPLSEIAADTNYYVTSAADGEFFIVIRQHEIISGDISDSMSNVSLLVAGISLVLCIAVALLLSRQLTKPVEALTGAMHEVEKGNLEASVVTKRRDELGNLSRSFNKMTKRLKDNVEYEVRKQQELDEANIAMMQAQLNPHFLYNTLDTIKWVAKANQIPEISSLSSNLAKILRKSISQERFVTLENELELCRSYIDIQQIRFDDKFTFETNVPDELLSCMIPKLILQPIVENSILHGLADSDRGTIIIDAAVENEDTLIITVSDDGCGISGEVMNHLNSHDRRQLVGHIGFFNADTIIRMHYGDRYGMNARNLANGGASITITLPVKKAETPQ